MKKIIIFVVVIIFIVTGFYFAYRNYKEKSQLKHMGRENFPVVGDSVTIKGSIMRTSDHLYVIFPYQPETKKETVFFYKECQKCSIKTALPGQIISNDENEFLPLSNYIPDKHEVRITGRLSEKESNGKLLPFIEINELEVLK